jgi:hypothetical protein
MLQPNDIVTLLNDYDNPTTSYLTGIEMDGLEKYVTPETDILSLVMLSKAKNQGLDVAFVDDDKFFDGSFTRIKGEMLNGTGPFDGAWYIEFELESVLLHGHTFSLRDHSESMGYGVNIDTANLINELIAHYLDGTGKVDYGSWEEVTAIETIQQLTDYINRMLTIPEPKEPWYSNLSSSFGIGGCLVVALGLVGMAVYYIIKFIFGF